MHPQRPLALVTGGRRGIGAAIAVALASDGFDVAITDVAVDGADDTLASIRACGARTMLLPSDLADIAAHENALDRIIDWGGPIACLVNNAGVPAASRSDLLGMSVESFDRVLGVNLRGTFFLTQAVARRMLADPPASPRTIVTISSVSAEMASVTRGEYCISKAGLAMLSRLFALRLAEAGIGVFEIRPGIIRTDMTRGVANQYDARIANGDVPARRWGEPQDVARAVAAAASGKLGFATGSVINVDGALSVPRL
jgi:NAD(P)-dependent dehydrogenase (short-subunit alcohol dehydrogenase family)